MSVVIPFRYMKCGLVIATVNCEHCQHSPDSYTSSDSIIHPIHFDWFNRSRLTARLPVPIQEALKDALKIPENHNDRVAMHQLFTSIQKNVAL